MRILKKKHPFPTLSDEEAVFLLSNEFIPNGELKIYPTIAADRINVSLQSNQQEKIQLELLSAQGTVIGSKVISGHQENETFEVGGLRSGVYFIRLRNGSNSRTVKVVRQ